MKVKFSATARKQLRKTKLRSLTVTVSAVGAKPVTRTVKLKR